MASLTYLHNIDPFVIQFTDQFGIRWYGLSYVAGFIASYYILMYLLKTNRTSLSSANVSSLINYALMGVLLGGRFGYCILYDPSLLVQFNSDFPFWGALAIHRGGMASHGGILGIIVAFFIFSKRYRVPVFHTLDLATVGGIGIFFGRIANFINGELYGRIIETKAWFGVQFPKEMYGWLYSWDQEKLLSLKPVISKLKSIDGLTPPSELSAGAWQLWVHSNRQFSNRIANTLQYILQLVEQGQMQVIAVLEKTLPVRHPSQLYQAVLEGLIPFLIVLFLWHRKKTRRHGLIAIVWGLSYLIMRVIGEVFREPDTHIGLELFNLTRGQWISIGLMIPLMFIIYYYIWPQQKKDRTQS